MAGRLRSLYGDVFAARLGCAAATLTRVAMTPEQVTDGSSQIERSTRNGEELVCRVPSLKPVVARILELLAEKHNKVEIRPPRPIHGSMRPDHFLIDGESIGMFDFDRFGSGDPEMDAATFIHDLEFFRSAVVPFDRLLKSFLEGYEAIARPLRWPLVTAYRAHARLGKSLRAAQAVRPHGDERAAELAQQALLILTGAY